MLIGIGTKWRLTNRENLRITKRNKKRCRAPMKTAGNSADSGFSGLLWRWGGMEDGMTELVEFLRAEGVSEALLRAVEDWRGKQAPVRPEAAHRVPKPRYPYYGRDVWEEAISALLSGEHLLLVGPKATGKNDLAENLSALFGRPQWDVSFYINTDAASLIGTDTLTDGQVSLRHGPIARCAMEGGFGVLDEINMAKNESLAVLHATLDFRRCIDVPGYDRIPLSDATRFIATMNYGYAGTRDLNEALASRFLVIDMPPITDENLLKLLRREFPALKTDCAQQFMQLFTDIRKKCDSAEISTKALDLRGLLASIRLMEQGLSAVRALDLGIVNKCFDDFERQLVRDVVQSRISEELTGRNAFNA